MKILNKLNKQDSHPLLEKLIEIGFQLLKTRL